jgi:hypothetical protein
MLYKIKDELANIMYSDYNIRPGEDCASVRMASRAPSRGKELTITGVITSQLAAHLIEAQEIDEGFDELERSVYAVFLVPQ